MSMDRLQEKIRKTKNVAVLDFDIKPDQIPPHILRQEVHFAKAYARFCVELLEGLKGLVPAVRFSFSAFALLGSDGLSALSFVSEQARKMGYYILLDAPEALSAQRAECNADLLFQNGITWNFDGLIITSFIGSDAIMPYTIPLEDADKSLFVAVRTGNRTAPELQDLLSGGRHVYEAQADIVNRFKNQKATRSGYDRVALIGPASSAAILKKLREKYKNLFILIDGYDYPNGNAKNCADAADKLGHGIAVCVGTSVTAAWQISEKDGTDYVEDAKEAVLRMKNNLKRYFTIL